MNRFAYTRADGGGAIEAALLPYPSRVPGQLWRAFASRNDRSTGFRFRASSARGAYLAAAFAARPARRSRSARAA